MKTLRAAFLLFLSALPAAAIPVDLELILAVDASRSVDDDEARLQRDGYIAALTDPRVLQAIKGGGEGRIAVMYFEWAATDAQEIVVPWTLIDSAATAQAFAARLAASPRMSRNWTSISAAIDFAVPQFDNNGFEGVRRVIDISGDGRNNQGRPAEYARDAAVEKGIVINGLPILNDRLQFGQREIGLDLYYRDAVIGGPGSFMIAANDFVNFTHAILSKLIREVAAAPAEQDRAAASPN